MIESFADDPAADAQSTGANAQSSEMLEAEGAGESEAALPPPSAAAAAKRRGPAARRRSKYYSSESDSEDEEDWDAEEDDAVRCYFSPAFQQSTVALVAWGRSPCPEIAVWLELTASLLHQ